MGKKDKCFPRANFKRPHYPSNSSLLGISFTCVISARASLQLHICMLVNVQVTTMCKGLMLLETTGCVSKLMATRSSGPGAV